MNDIKTILEELYEVDPSLREHEPKLTMLIQELLAHKPSVQLSSDTRAHIREQLLAKSAEFKAQPSGVPPSWRALGMPLAVLAVLIFAVFGIGYFTSHRGQLQTGIGPMALTQGDEKIAKFTSDKEFADYFANVQELNSSGYFYGGTMGGMRMVPTGGVAEPLALDSLEMKSQAISNPAAAASDSRVSNTNVQVLGIDEPDIAKTNGKEIYYAAQPQIYYMQGGGATMPEPLMKDNVQSKPMIMPPRYPQPQVGIRVIGVTSPKDITALSNIDRYGEMLLDNKNLVVFSGQTIYGYDVSDPKKPAEKWNVELQNSNLVTSRLLGGKLYIVTQTYLQGGSPCPIRPLVVNGKDFPIPCVDIYHPIAPVADAVTYHVFQIDPNSGDVARQLSFVGSGGSSVVYMSPESLYVTYAYQSDVAAMLADFLTTDGKGMLPDSVVERIKTIASYDISTSSKLNELQTAIQSYLNGLDKDEQARVQNEIQNRMSDYTKKHLRDLQKTGIVKIGLDSLAIEAKGNVPGTLLNQFSLDEYKGNLRVATTVGRRNVFWGGWGIASGANESVNDVYVLDGNLAISGAVQDLGVSERIYSVRFIENRGYIVTFRETDPFYVIDLSNAKNPKVAGQLKIPGYSSYLHPLTDSIILGVGQDGQNVKLSLFDVSDPANPKEIDKYILNEYWTEVENNYHAFLQDKDHHVFFLPGGQGAHIFSYDDNKLDLKKSVSEINPKRALYINDDLYILTENKIVVLDENSWQRVSEFELK